MDKCNDDDDDDEEAAELEVAVEDAELITTGIGSISCAMFSSSVLSVDGIEEDEFDELNDEFNVTEVPIN